MPKIEGKISVYKTKIAHEFLLNLAWHKLSSEVFY